MQYRVKFSDEAEFKLKRLSHQIAGRIRDKVTWVERVNNPRKYLRKVEGIPDLPTY